MQMHILSKSILLAASAAFLLGTTACSIPSYSGTGTGIGSSSGASSEDATINSIDATLSDDFIMGFDASMVSAIESAGSSFYNNDGTTADVLQILKDHGVNCIRLRIWNNPDNANAGTPAGNNTYERTKSIAVRAKNLGLKVLLDFHYSDTWADPAKQKCPSDWDGDTTIAALSQHVYDYTYSTLNNLKKAGALPDMVQIGNEIDAGMFLTKSDGTAANVTAAKGTSNLATVLNKASSAVRAISSDIEIIVHLSRGGYSALYTSFFDCYATHNGANATVQTVDFDTIGLSYYPYYSSHKTLADLKSNLSNLQTRYNKKVIIAEISYGFTKDYGDNTDNEFWTDDEERAYTNLVTSSNESDFDITTDDDENKCIAGTVQNQANVIRAVIEVAALTGAEGVCYWGGDWIPATGIADNWENQAMFDFDGRCLKSMNVFNLTGN